MTKSADGPRARGRRLTRAALLVLPLLAACAGEGPGPASSDSCTEGELRDTTGACVPEECGDGPWGDLTGATLFVLEGADGSGETEDDPAGSLNGTLTDAEDGDVIAIGAGEFSLARKVSGNPSPVTLRGRCPALTRLVGSDAETPVFDVQSSDASLRLEGLTVAGGRFAVRVTSGAFEAKDVDFRDNVDVAVVASGAHARVSLEDVFIADTRPPTDVDAGGTGLVVLDGASATAKRLTVSGVGGTGIAAAGSELVLDDVTVEDTWEAVPGHGTGMLVGAGAMVTASGLALRRNVGAGLALSKDGVAGTLSARVEGCEIADTYADSTGNGTGVFASRVDNLELRDCVVSGTEGQGLFLDSSVVELTSTAVSDNAKSAIFASSTELRLHGVSVSDTRVHGEDADAAYGLEVIEASEVTGETVSVQGSTGVGVFVEDSSVTLDGLDVSGTLLTDGTSGSALLARRSDVDVRSCLLADGGLGVATEDSTLTLSSCTLDGLVGGGLTLWTTTGTLTDVNISDTTWRSEGGAGGGGGYGIGAFGGSLTLTRVGVHRAEIMGITLFDSVTVSMSEVEITDVTRAGDLNFAVGLVTGVGSGVDVGDLAVRRIDGIGIYASNGATVRCTSCLVDHAEIAGVAIQGADFTAAGATITDVAAGETTGLGVGIYASDEGGTASLGFTGGTVAETDRAAVLVKGEGAYQLVGSDLAGGDYGRVLPNGNVVLAIGTGLDGLVLEEIRSTTPRTARWC